jgi:hypothetical protein
MENRTLTAGTVSIRFEPLLAQPCDRELTDISISIQIYIFISRVQESGYIDHACYRPQLSHLQDHIEDTHVVSWHELNQDPSGRVNSEVGKYLLQTLVTQFTALYGSSYKRTHLPHSHQASIANSSHFSWGQWFDILVLETMSTIIKTMGNNSKTLVPPTYTNNSDHQNNNTSLKWLNG